MVGRRGKAGIGQQGLVNRGVRRLGRRQIGGDVIRIRPVLLSGRRAVRVNEYEHLVFGGVGPHPQAGVGEAPVLDELELVVHLFQDQRQRGQWLIESADQLAVLHQMVHPENDDRGKLMAAGQHENHLAGPQFHRAAVRQFDFHPAFEINNLESAIGRGGDNQGGADHGRRGRAGVDGAAALAVGRVEQQAALLQVDRAVGRLKGKDRVRPHPRHRLVLRHQLRPRGVARSQDVRDGENVVDRRRLLPLLGGGNDLHIVDHLRQPGLLQVHGATGADG